MNLNKRTLIHWFWFAAEVIGIFLVIQIIRIIFGRLDALYSGLSLVIISGILFLTAFLIARKKDKHHNNIQKNPFSELI